MYFKTSTQDEIDEHFERINNQNKKQLQWDLFFLGLARYISTKSKDPSTKVGAVIVDKNNRLVSTGWNGLPQKIKDDPDILNNREIKYKRIIHAEINAVVFSGNKDLSGCTLYTYPFMPCCPCSSIVIQSGITRIVAPRSDNPRWQSDFVLTRENCKDAYIDLQEIDYEETPTP